MFRDNQLYDHQHPEKGYRGSKGNFAFRQMLHDSGAAISVDNLSITLPIEQDGGHGMAHGHFDEKCLYDEIMTGHLGPSNTFSNITLAVLHDLGYGVNYTQAVNYTLPIDRVQTCLQLLNITIPTPALTSAPINDNIYKNTTKHNKKRNRKKMMTRRRKMNQGKKRHKKPDANQSDVQASGYSKRLLSAYPVKQALRDDAKTKAIRTGMEFLMLQDCQPNSDDDGELQDDTDTPHQPKEGVIDKHCDAAFVLYSTDKDHSILAVDVEPVSAYNNVYF